MANRSVGVARADARTRTYAELLTTAYPVPVPPAFGSL